MMIIAIDIEGRGPSAIRNGIVSIGVAVATKDGKLVEKRRFDILPYPRQTMDSKCFNEFWSKQGDLLHLLESHATSPSVAMASFRGFIDQWSEVYLICDTPAYDFSFINYYLDNESLPLLQFDRDGNFRATHDGDSYARGRCHYSFERQWISNDDACKQMGVVRPTTPLRAHLPEDDAHGILLTHLALVMGNVSK
jgi:hypothetical protein